eukprot:4785102-Pleurochrysis_carterae.AAC.2
MSSGSTGVGGAFRLLSLLAVGVERIRLVYTALGADVETVLSLVSSAIANITTSKHCMGMV